MNKKTIGIIGVIILVIVLLICATIKPKEKESPQNEADILTNAQIESQSLKDAEKKEFIEIDINEYMNKYNSGERSLIFIGRPTCQYCQIVDPIVKYLAYRYNLDIYYLNTDNFDDEANTIFVQSNEEFSKGYGTPMLLIVSNGTINDMVDGLTDTTHYLEFLMKNGIVK